jgi:hypothetical protein
VALAEKTRMAGFVEPDRQRRKVKDFCRWPLNGPFRAEKEILVLKTQAFDGLRRLRPGLVETAFQAEERSGLADLKGRFCQAGLVETAFQAEERSWFADLKGRFCQPRRQAAPAAEGLGN